MQQMINKCCVLLGKTFGSFDRGLIVFLNFFGNLIFFMMHLCRLINSFVVFRAVITPQCWHTGLNYCDSMLPNDH